MNAPTPAPHALVAIAALALLCVLEFVAVCASVIALERQRHARTLARDRVREQHETDMRRLAERSQRFLEDATHRTAPALVETLVAARRALERLADPPPDPQCTEPGCPCRLEECRFCRTNVAPWTRVELDDRDGDPFVLCLACGASEIQKRRDSADRAKNEAARRAAASDTPGATNAPTRT